MIVVLGPNPVGRRANEITKALHDLGTRPKVVGPLRRGRWDSFAKAAKKAIVPGTWLVAAGSVPPLSPLDAFAELIDEAHARESFAFVDLRGEVLGSALVAGPDVVSVSLREASTALGRDMGREEDAVWGAREFLRGSGARTRLVIVRGMGGLAFAAHDPQGGDALSGSRSFGRMWDAGKLDAAFVWAFHRAAGRVPDVQIVERVVSAAAGAGYP